jgi:flagellar FliJ protein
MAELRSILLAIEHATRQRDELVKVAARAKRNVGFAEDQMAQLQGYATETDSRWTGAAPGVLSAELIRHHYQFMDRLQQAIGMQSGVLANSRRQLELANKTLLQAEFRLSGLNQILKTRQTALLRKQERREQRQTDEFAAMLYTRARASAVSGETK